jgi:3,4-dihydroxy 2-butanone 4-phosphate synthase/GTP cyclohydrolase II
MSELLTVEEAIDRIRQGRQIILVDDEDRENEGDLCMAAEKVTADDINFMARFGRGLICLTLTERRAQQLGLNKMTERNRSRFGTNFYVSIEARQGVSTGISAADRATTIQAAIAEGANQQSVVSPGHIFPICARRGGVLVRSGQTEGSVDLARLAGLEPAGVICEIMKDDGTMARMPDLEVFAREHDLGILTIAQLIQYRLQRESLVQTEFETEVSPAGLEQRFKLKVFKSSVNDAQYVALILGDVRSNEPVLVRVHRACIPGDVFRIETCGCDRKMRHALQQIGREGAGVFVYVHPGLLDLVSQIQRHVLGQGQSEAPKGEGLPPELRDFGLGAQVLATIGLSKIRLMTDNPKRIVGLRSYGLEVVERVQLGEEGDGDGDQS